MVITSECVNCEACQPECRNGAISRGEDIHLIDRNRCTECAGIYNEPRCAKVCAVGCIIHSN